MKKITQAVAAASALLLLAAGCGKPKMGPGIELEEQLNTIATKTGITDAYKMQIYLDYLVVTATYQGKPYDLSLKNGEIEPRELSDELDRVPRGSLPLSNFDAQELINRYRQLEGSSECAKPTVHDDVAPTGKHVLRTSCFTSHGEKYLAGSTTIDGQPVIDSPDPFNPEHVSSLAFAHSGIFPDAGAITSWTITADPEPNGTAQDAYAPRAATIFGTTCIPTAGTHLATYQDGDFLAPPTKVSCANRSESDAPIDPNTQKPTFRLADYDPNLVNIAAQQIKAETGLDITQPMPIGYLIFTPAKDDSQNLTWTFESAAAIGLNKVTGTLEPIK